MCIAREALFFAKRTLHFHTPEPSIYSIRNVHMDGQDAWIQGQNEPFVFIIRMGACGRTMMPHTPGRAGQFAMLDADLACPQAIHARRDYGTCTPRIRSISEPRRPSSTLVESG